MSENIYEKDGELGGVLRQVSIQLRGSLGNIYNALSRIAPPELRDGEGGIDQDAAVLCQSYYRILRLANNLSDAAALEGPGQARLRNGDIAGFCREVMEKAEPPARLLGIQLAFRCEKASHIIAMDSGRLERMMLNLLSNAFKFTTGAEKRVTLEVRIGPKWVELALSDTGPGIPPELQETIFDRYRHTWRLDPPPHGLGLGLPLSRRIAQEHGGTLLITSRVGEGTTVTVSLPNRREAAGRMSDFLVDLDGGFNKTLAGLADALPREAFTQKYLD